MVKKRYIFFGISIVILLVIIWYANPVILINIIMKSDVKYLILAFVITTLSMCIRVLKWNVLLNNVRFVDLFPVQMLGITISNLTPGKIAEPIKAIILKVRTGVSVSSSFPSIIWERIMDVVILILFALVAIQIFGFQSNLMFLSFMSIGLFVILIIILLFVLTNKKFGYKLFGFLRKFPLIKKVSQNFMKNFYKSKIKKRRLLMCLFFTFVSWFLDGIAFYLTLLALNITINPIILSGIIALSVLIGIVSTLPGGLGSTETVMILLLSLVGVYSTIAIAGVMLLRLISFWYSMFVGGLSFIYLSKKIDFNQLKKL